MEYIFCSLFLSDPGLASWLTVPCGPRSCLCPSWTLLRILLRFNSVDKNLTGWWDTICLVLITNNLSSFDAMLYSFTWHVSWGSSGTLPHWGVCSPTSEQWLFKKTYLLAYTCPNKKWINISPFSIAEAAMLGSHERQYFYKVCPKNKIKIKVEAPVGEVAIVLVWTIVSYSKRTK